MSASLGVTLDGWQELILEAAMGERSDRTWAAKRVGISVPRQNGKSQLMVARILAGALLFGEKKIVVSAHQQDTAREAFTKLVEIIEADGNESLRARLDPKFGRDGIMNAINRESVGFRNGARVQFKARSGAGGKGFSSDCLLLDEAQILGTRAWTSINSTMSAMRNPQVWLLGTPPQEEDDCYTFDMVRKAAVDGKSTAAAWVEWAVDTGSDEYQGARADIEARRWTPAIEYLCWSGNPAWNQRINLEVVQGEFETYDPEKFSQDRFGIWPSEIGGSRLITADQWKASGVESAPDGVRSLGVAFSADGKRQAVGGAVKHPDGVHVEIIGAQTGSAESGVRQLVDWLTVDPSMPERWRSFAQIVVAGRPGAPLVAALRDRGVGKRVLINASGPEYFTACAMTLDAVRDGSLTHSAVEGQRVLDDSVSVCDKKQRGQDGGWSWEPTTADGDETPIEAVSLALWAAKTSNRVPGRGARITF